MLGTIAKWLVAAEDRSKASLKRLSRVNRSWWTATRTVRLASVAYRGQGLIDAACLLPTLDKVIIQELALRHNFTDGPRHECVAHAAINLVFSTPSLRRLVLQGRWSLHMFHPDALPHQVLVALTSATHMRPSPVSPGLTHLYLYVCTVDWPTFVTAARNTRSLHTVSLLAVVFLHDESPELGTHIIQATHVTSLAVAHVKWEHQNQWHVMAATFAGVTALALAVRDFGLDDLAQSTDLERAAAALEMWSPRCHTLEISMGRNGNGERQNGPFHPFAHF